MVNEFSGLRLSLTIGLFVVLIVALPLVYAQATGQLTVTVNPSSISVPQGTLASYMVSLTGSPCLFVTRCPTEIYSLSVDGLPGGAQGGFGSNPVTLSGGAASTSLSLDTSMPPLYCPNTYPFIVTATGSSGAYASSGPASLTVTQVGPSLQVSVSSDKSSYILGQKITITVTANRPAEGTLTVTPPSGAPMTYQLAFGYGSYVATETLTAANPYGTWTMNVKADDYCGVTSSASGEFATGPNTYDVHVSLSGLPANMSAGLQVDGASRGKISGAQTRTLSLPIGTQHVISVDQFVYGGTNGTRYFAAQNNWTVAAAGSHAFQYQTEYLLTEKVSVGYDNETFYGPPCCGNTTVKWALFTTTAGYPLQTHIWYPAGTIVTLGQPSKVIGWPNYPNGTRLLYGGVWIGCDNRGSSSCIVSGGSPPTIIMNGPHTTITSYDLQYRLWLVSDYGNPQLPGLNPTGINGPWVSHANGNLTTIVSAYYDAGTTATASVTSPLGFTIQYVFAFWTPNSSLVSSPTSPSTGVVMEGPMVLTAIWSASYTLLYYEIGGGIAAVAVIVLAAKYFGHGLRLRKPSTGGPGPVEEPVEEF